MADPKKRRNWKKKRRAIIMRRMLVIGLCLLLTLAVIVVARSCGRQKELTERKESGSRPEDVTESVDSGETEAGTESKEDDAAGSEEEPAELSGENAGTAENGETDGESVPEDTADGQKPDEPLTISAEIVPDERSFKLTAVGDCTFGRDINAGYSGSFDEYFDEHGSDYFFDNVRDILSADDLTIINFEGTLTESEDRKDKTYAFKARPKYVDILTDGSVEACNLANNHSDDYGKQSYTDTIENITNAGISVFGYDRTAVIDVNGVKVGMIGYLELWDEYDTEPKMIDGIEKLKEQGAEVIIVTMHWGTEKEQYPDSIQQYLGHSAIDHGAHLVIGHHPHRIQGIEIYKGRAICYSLANFTFGGNRHPSDMDTFIFQQTFTVKDGEVQENEDYTVIPCSISSHSDYNDYKPRVLTGESGERCLNKVKERSEPFNKD